MFNATFLLVLLATVHCQNKNGDLDSIIKEIFGSPSTGSPEATTKPGLVTRSANIGSTVVPGATTSTEDKSCTTDDGVVGECVSYYLCDKNYNTIIDDGIGIIDTRARDGPCQSYLDICCQLSDKRTPDNPITPPPFINQIVAALAIAAANAEEAKKTEKRGLSDSLGYGGGFGYGSGVVYGNGLGYGSGVDYGSGLGYGGYGGGLGYGGYAAAPAAVSKVAYTTHHGSLGGYGGYGGYSGLHGYGGLGGYSGYSGIGGYSAGYGGHGYAAPAVSYSNQLGYGGYGGYGNGLSGYGGVGGYGHGLTGYGGGLGYYGHH